MGAGEEGVVDSASSRAPAPPAGGTVPLRQATLPILAAGLGYFVDVFDLLLFSVLRVPSLTELGADPLTAGAAIQNWQLVGMMLGGFVWGLLGDFRGRLTVLFASIFLYSGATLASAFVTTEAEYTWLRFVAGVGLAGELGAGLTLVSEHVEKKARGTATTIVTTLGVLGAVAAGLLGDLLPWRQAYVVGGCLGFGLFVFRISLTESQMFRSVRTQRGLLRQFSVLFSTRERSLRYLRCVLLGLPIWFSVPVFITFAPEFARALGNPVTISAGTAVLWYFVGTTVGDFSCGLSSQFLQSRKRAMFIYLMLSAAAVLLYFAVGGRSPRTFYAACAALGFGNGYWAVTITAAVEQFGTNLRATVGTSVPTLIRACAVPMTLAFLALRDAFGMVGSASLVGLAAFGLALGSLWFQTETYARDLDFEEQ